MRMQRVDFGSGEVDPRLENVEWGCTTDETQKQVLPEGLPSTDGAERWCNQE